MFREPESISRAVHDRVAYKPDSDPQSEWQSPERTWDNRTGDCEDFALAVEALNKEQGLDARVYVVSSRTLVGSNAANADPHAVAIGTHNGQMWVSSNGQHTEVAGLRDAKDMIAREQGWFFDDVEVVDASSRPQSSAGTP